MMRTASAIILTVGALAGGCHSGSNQPVDIYPEDNCSNCRMAISNERFAAEIIDQEGAVFKFDDLGCMLRFRDRLPDAPIIYVKDYESKRWISFDNAFVVETGITTPMGSGKIAFRDSVRARQVLQDSGWLPDREPAK